MQEADHGKLQGLSGGGTTTALASVVDRPNDFYAPDEVRAWLHAPHPRLGGERAVDLIDAGRVEEVPAIVGGLDAGAYLWHKPSWCRPTVDQGPTVSAEVAGMALEIDANRFILRDFTDADRAAFLAYQADPHYRALHGPDEANPRHAEDLLVRFAFWAEERPRRNYQLAVARKASGELLGCAGLRLENCCPGEGELGIELAPAHWGRYACAVEVARTLLAFGFVELGLRVIVGGTGSGNRRVARLAAWFGAEVGATRPGPAWMTARGWHEVEWRATREGWRESKAGGRRTLRVRWRVASS
ncbi:MAG: GNAT family N-acetyltransferase [Geminicoccaceae bacterium]|nr:GNAT family N-acetyltransferase [Geminicoccaceae bacterium]